MLNILSKNHGFKYLTVADDLRQGHETSSLTGLAIVLPTSDSYWRDEFKKCCIVKIDTLIHKSQHIVERDSIPIILEDDVYRSCALLSDSLAIVLG